MIRIFLLLGASYISAIFQLPYDEVIKSCSSIVRVLSPLEVKTDSYYEFYRPFEFSIVSDLLAFTISHSVRDFMPNSIQPDFSPFAVNCFLVLKLLALLDIIFFILTMVFPGTGATRKTPRRAQFKKCLST